MLDRLMSIRFHEYRGMVPKVSEFFDALEVDVLAGCRYKSRMKPLTKASEMGRKLEFKEFALVACNT